ncbi:MAG: DHA2 family efflux MFS transporter permease subunit [Nitrospira sp.]|nr:DHA2 family efflux MFS transporter permease subunit [Nitrospira sp.]
MTLQGRERLRGWRFTVFNMMLGSGHMVVLFNAGAYTALSPHTAGDLEGVSTSFASWATTDFMIALALGFPPARWLAQRYGDLRAYVVAFIVFADASLACALSESLRLFLPGRMVLGFAGGLTLPLGQSLFLEEYPDRLKSVGLGVWGFFALLPFTIGLGLGGWIADELGWRSLFQLDAVAGLVVAAIVGALLYGRLYEARETPFDVVGFLLLGVVLVGIQTILNQGNDFDWFDSPFLATVLAIVVAAIPVFIIWELGTPFPAVDLHLFRRRNFAIGTLVLCAGFFCFQGLLSMFVVQLQILLDYSAWLAGKEFFSMMLLGIPMLVLTHIYSVSHGFDARIFASVTCLGFAGTFYWLGLFDESHSFDQLFWPMVVEGLFLGSFFIPLNMLTLHGVPEEQVLQGAETATLFRIAAGGLGISGQGVVVFRRTPFHQLHLADHFGGRVSASFDPLHEAAAALRETGFDQTTLPAKLVGLIKQQSAILSMNDAFLFSAYVFLTLTALVWCAAPTRLGGTTGRDDWRGRQAEELMEEV